MCVKRPGSRANQRYCAHWIPMVESLGRGSVLFQTWLGSTDFIEAMAAADGTVSRNVDLTRSNTVPVSLSEFLARQLEGCA